MPTPNQPLPTHGTHTTFTSPTRRTNRGFQPDLLRAALESRDVAGSFVGGILAAAFGELLVDPLSEMTRFAGESAMIGHAPAPTAELTESQASGQKTRWLTPDDTWVNPLLLGVDAHCLPKAVIEGVVISSGRQQTNFADIVRPSALIGQKLQGNPTATSSVYSPATQPVWEAPFIGVAQRPLMLGTQASETVEQGRIVAVNRILDPIATTNQAPQAVNDSVTVVEDGSVVFDPTVNDTDADTGDVLWVKSVQSETDVGRIVAETNGMIRYIPNPNFHSYSKYPYFQTDKFTYEVTDGLATATGTVTVTVTDVNDAPVAANDVMIFTNYYYGTPAGTSGTMTYEVDSSFYPGLLANDKDYDKLSSTVTVGAKDFTGTEGTVTVTSDGKVTWSGLKSYVGETSFKYRAADSQGMLSDWVTVKLICNPINTSAGAVTAVSEDVPVGDGPDTGNVLSNDTGSFVILSSQPTSGRLTNFGFDGAFEYLSAHTRTEESISYQVFSQTGLARAAALAKFTVVNLTIHHGQSGTAVRELSEYAPLGSGGGSITGTTLIPVFEPTGAFTVANLNDSDADGTIDNVDDNVPAKQVAGQG